MLLARRIGDDEEEFDCLELVGVGTWRDPNKWGVKPLRFGKSVIARRVVGDRAWCRGIVERRWNALGREGD